MPWPGIFWGVALDAVVVRGSSTCPSPPEVAAKLAPLVRASSDPPDVAEISRQGTTISISLTRSDGHFIGRQTLDGAACQDLADAAAVVLASWENDDSRREGLFPAEASRSTSPRASSEGPDLHGRTWNVALGIGGALADGSVSPTAMASASITPFRWPIGWRVTGGWAGSGTVDFSHGRVHWTRFVVGGGPEVIWATTPIVGEAHIGAGLGWVRSAGEGFTEDRQDRGYELSLVGSVRISSAGPGFRPWLEAAVAFWPSPVVAYELPPGTERRLPVLAATVTAGVLFGR